ncbi:EI24 domain-containing protein [Kitasatospora sp. NPDC048407]|uniref:EI24 domain-containing protein n=1 Tax=Kitasatospora sp. NPDC048407 TaxID=3364051 RepID=UPI00371A51D6
MRDFGAGLRFLFNGQRWVARHGRWWGFGMIPALITLIGYLAALAVLITYAGDLAAWATPFADHWSTVWRDTVRIAVGAAAVGMGGLLAMLTFTAVTLLIGEPFYESLSAKVEETEGGGPQSPDLPLWRELWAAARDSLAILLRAAGLGILLFLCGFIPVVGQTVLPVIGICVSGFFLTVELTGTPLQKRGLSQKQRLRLLRSRMSMAVGFGAGLVLLFLIPVLTVLAMPGAVAGATLLAREIAPHEDPEPVEEPDDGPDGHPADPYPSQPYHQPPHPQNPYQQNPYQQPYPQNPYPQNPYQQPHPQNPYQQQPYPADPRQQG